MKFLKLNAILWMGLLGGFSMQGMTAYAQDNSHTITTRNVDANGAPIITTTDSNDNPGMNAPDSLNLGPASQQYVQQQQQRRIQREGRMPEAHAFGVGLLALLIVAVIAYAVHPKQKDTNDLRNVPPIA